MTLISTGQDGTVSATCSCALVFDEMSIKEFLEYNCDGDHADDLDNLGPLGTTRKVANHVLVFMLRSVQGRGTQSLRYFLTVGPVKSEMLGDLTDLCLDKTREAGFCVKCIICDQGSNNRSVFSKRGVTTETPYFMYKDNWFLEVIDRLLNIFNSSSLTSTTLLAHKH